MLFNVHVAAIEIWSQDEFIHIYQRYYITTGSSI